MKTKISIHEAGVDFDKVFEASSDTDLFRQFREAVESRLGFLKRAAVHRWSDNRFIAYVVNAYDASKAIPDSVEGFVEFGRRNGFVTDLTG